MAIGPIMRVMTYQGDKLTWDLSPLEALKRWPRDQRVLMLHSGRPDAKWSRYTILTTASGAYRFDATPDGSGRSVWLGDPAECPASVGQWSHHPLNDLERVLADRESLWVGYLGYGVGRFIEKLPCRAQDDRGWPIVQMHRCPGWLVHDNQTNTWSACGVWRGGQHADMPDLPRLSADTHLFHADEPKPDVSQETHEAAVARAIKYIAAGDVFQVNLTQRFTAQAKGDPRGLYETLAQNSPAWYGAYLELMSGRGEGNASSLRRTIACTSPELFFSLDEERNVVTRPIKGTRPATADASELLESDKDAAELTMIVDLLRNDLGRVCAYGSVHVPEARVIETHPTVHHTTATVTGKLHPSKTLIDLIRAVMPGGSITGAPKVRAMQIIDELEPVMRGPYTGAIGYIHKDTANFNITIRTMLVETDAQGEGRVDYAVGGGVVADSTPTGEYHESLDKAAAMKSALAACRTPQPIHAG
jgi:para-aminobenzoate synthetase component 1